MKFQKKDIAIFLALLFHICGAIGILFTPYKQWFVQHTPLNLVLMALLIVYVQPSKNMGFFLFLLIAFVVGMASEIIGVNTGQLFGEYAYGTVMGPKLLGVPYLIGLQWFVTIFCSGTIIQLMQSWVDARMAGAKRLLPERIRVLSLIVDGALLAVLFDFVMEPVAMKLGFWQWKNNIVPFYNYVCWLVISSGLLLVFRLLGFNKANHFAIHLFIIQLLFFMALSIGL